VVALALALNVAAFSADKYETDLAHSSVGFSVKHLVISNTRGEFSDFAGTIMLDEKDVTKSSVEVTIKAASVNTHDAKRDNHLRSADFFAVEKYPEIVFKSKKVVKTGEGHSLVGDLTIRDVTKEVSFPFTLVGPITDPWGNKRIAAQASFTVNRKDFGVSWNKALDGGGWLVGDDVTITLEVEAVHAKPGTN
jgi:polyisoprenoid-binding protein YceI